MKSFACLQYTRRRMLSVAALAALSAVAAPFINGCDPTPKAADNSGASPAASGATATTAAPVTVHLAFFPNVTHAAALYGTGTGEFQKAFGDTAKIETRVFTAGPAEIEALFAGEVDLGYIGPGPAINGYLKSDGQALKIIAGASSGGTALVARGDESIKSIADLAGKKVAVPQKGGTQDISLHHAIEVAKLAPKDKGGNVEILEYAPADTLTQFKLKTVDAAWVPEPWVARLESEAGAKVVVDEKSLWPGGKFSTAVVIVRADFLKQHPDLVAKFVQAHAAVVAEINKDPDAARKVIGDQIKSLNHGKALPDAILKAALARTEITADPLQDSVLTFADWSKAAGYLRQDRSALAGLFSDSAKQTASSGVPAGQVSK